MKMGENFYSFHIEDSNKKLGATKTFINKLKQKYKEFNEVVIILYVWMRTFVIIKAVNI